MAETMTTHSITDLATDLAHALVKIGLRHNKELNLLECPVCDRLSPLGTPIPHTTHHKGCAMLKAIRTVQFSNTKAIGRVDRTESRAEPTKPLEQSEFDRLRTCKGSGDPAPDDWDRTKKRGQCPTCGRNIGMVGSKIAKHNKKASQHV